MNLPVIYLILPAAIASACLLIKDRPEVYRGILLGLTLLLGISAILLGRNTSNTFNEIIIILGRSLTVRGTELPFVGFIYLIAFLYLTSTISSDSTTNFPAICVLYCSLNIASYSIDPFLYSVLIIFLANVVYLPVFSIGEKKQISGRMRFLVFQMLSVFLILLAGWILAGGEIAPVNENQLFFSSVLLGFGIALWLGAFPFYSWIPLFADEVSYLPFGFMMTIIPLSSVMMLLKLLNDFAWLREYNAFFLALQYLGALMILLGSAGAFFQKSLNRMFAFLLIMGIGLLLCAVGFIPFVSTELVSMWILVYVFACVSISIGYHKLVDGSKVNSIDALNGLFHEKPEYSILLISGLLSLIGFPFFSGFIPTLNLLDTTFRAAEFINITILLGQLFLLFSVVRLVLRLVLHSEKTFKLPSKIRLDQIDVVILIIINIILGFFPNLVYGQFADMIAKIFPLL